MRSRLYFRVYVKSLVVGLNNLRLVDWTLLRGSRMSLIVAGRNLLLEGLSEPSLKCKYFAAVYDQWFCSNGSIKIIRAGSIVLV